MDDEPTSTDHCASEQSSLQILLPPRMVIENERGNSTRRTPPYDLQAVAEGWAARRKYRIVAYGHVIACTRTKRLMFIDFVMEHEKDASILLACVYYSPCRGGEGLRVARGYMQDVQLVCNSQMDFFPRVLALCIYDSSELSRAASVFNFQSTGKTCFSSSFPVSFESSRRRRSTVLRRKRGGQFPKVYATDATLNK